MVRSALGETSDMVRSLPCAWRSLAAAIALHTPANPPPIIRMSGIQVVLLLVARAAEYGLSGLPCFKPGGDATRHRWIASLEARYEVGEGLLGERASPSEFGLA